MFYLPGGHANHYTTVIFWWWSWHFSFQSFIFIYIFLYIYVMVYLYSCSASILNCTEGLVFGVMLVHLFLSGSRLFFIWMGIEREREREREKQRMFQNCNMYSSTKITCKDLCLLVYKLLASQPNNVNVLVILFHLREEIASMRKQKPLYWTCYPSPGISCPAQTISCICKSIKCKIIVQLKY